MNILIDESNPAGRLHKILSAIKRQPDKRKVREAWSSATECGVEDIEVYKSVIELFTLSQEIQWLIKMKEGLNHDLYLSSFERLEKAFFPLNLDTTASVVKQHLTDEAMTRLQFCAEELQGFYSEDSLSEKEFQDIKQKVEDLFNVLAMSSLPDILRFSLLEEVEKIRNSIALYKIKGAKGLREALQSTIGAVVANQADIKAASVSNPDVIARLGELIDKIDLFSSRALKLKRALAKPIRFVLEKISEYQDSYDEEESIT